MTKEDCDFLGSEEGIGGQYYWATREEEISFQKSKVEQTVGCKSENLKNSKRSLEQRIKTKGPEAGMESRNPEWEAETLVKSVQSNTKELQSEK